MCFKHSPKILKFQFFKQLFLHYLSFSSEFLILPCSVQSLQFTFPTEVVSFSRLVSVNVCSLWLRFCLGGSWFICYGSMLALCQQKNLLLFRFILYRSRFIYCKCTQIKQPTQFMCFFKSTTQNSKRVDGFLQHVKYSSWLSTSLDNEEISV